VAALGSTSESGDLHDLKLILILSERSRRRHVIELHLMEIASCGSNGRFRELYVPHAIMGYCTVR